MRQVKKGSTNISVELYIIDATAGTPELGVLWDTAGIDLNYRRDGAVVTSITEKALSGPALTDAHDDGGFLEVANGRYRLDVPDAAFATAAPQVTVGGTVTGMVVLPVTIQLVDFDPDDAVRMGLTSLPNAAADAPGGLPISDAGGLDLDTLLGVLTSLAAATRSANLLDQFKTIIAVIESQRGFHTHQPGTGAILFIDDVNGDTHANGNRGGVSDPYATHADAETNAGTDFGHDLYIFVAGTTGGVSTHTEEITVNNGYSLLRGPGRGQILTSTGAVKTINVVSGSDGIEVSGFQITSDVSTGQDGIDITDADFHRVHNCWFLDTRGDGIHMLRATNSQIHDNHFEGTGTLGSGQGIHIVGTAGASSDNAIYNNHFAATAGDSLLIENGTTNDTEIHHNTFHNSAGWGVNIGGSSTDAQVHNNIFGNNASGDINDGGTTSIIRNNEQWAKQSLLVYGYFSIHIDTVGGASGSTEGENGTRGNPVNNLADAVTLNTSLGFDHYHLHGASLITLASAHSNWVFEGQDGATVNLGGVNTNGSHFECLTVTGDADGNDITTRFCKLQSLTNFIADAQFCVLIDDVTQSAGDHYWFQCASGVAGVQMPYVDVNGDGVNARNNHFRGWLGGLEERNHTSADLTSFDCPAGQLVVAAGGTGGTIAARGNINITDSASGAVTIEENAVVNMSKINAEADTALADYDGPTKAEMDSAHATTDTLVTTRTLPAAAYFDPAADTVANVTTVGSVTTKTGYAVSATGLDLVTKTATFALAVADAILIRDIENVKDEYAKHSLGAAGLGGGMNFVVSSNTLTLLDPSDDSPNERFTYTLSTTEDVDPVTGVT